MTGLGEVRTLKIKELLDFGATLDNDGNDLFLPQSDLTRENEVGDELKVFIFENKSKDLEATTDLPKLTLNQVGLFKVTAATSIGAFVDIGTKREILIPPRELMRAVSEGESIVMTLKRDDQKQMLFGSTRIRAHFKNYGMTYKRGDKIKGMVIERTDLGRRVLVEGKHVGLLMEREIYTALYMGDPVTVFVREVKGTDLYLSMHQEGEALINSACKTIMEFLEFHNGYARLHDDSPSEEINLRLKMSKKTFKKACGKLFKEGKVILTKRGVKLANNDNSSLETKADKGGFKKQGDHEPLSDKRYDPKTGNLKVHTRAESSRETKRSWEKANSTEAPREERKTKYRPNPRRDPEGDAKREAERKASRSSSGNRRKPSADGGRSKFKDPKSGSKSGGKSGSWKKSSGSSDRGRSKKS